MADDTKITRPLSLGIRKQLISYTIPALDRETMRGLEAVGLHPTPEGREGLAKKLEGLALKYLSDAKAEGAELIRTEQARAIELDLKAKIRAGEVAKQELAHLEQRNPDLNGGPDDDTAPYPITPEQLPETTRRQLEEV